MSVLPKIKKKFFRAARSTLGIVLLMFGLMIPAPAQSKMFVFVFLNTNPNREELPKEKVDSLQAAHMANIDRLANDGKLLAAGPFEGGGGLFVFGATSKAEVEEWLRSDPAVRANRWVIEMFPYTPRIGSVCSVGEDYKMTTRTFLRYDVKDNGKRGEAAAVYDAFVGTLPRDSVVAEGRLGGGESGILILRGGIGAEEVGGVPALRKSGLAVTVKKLWIARGSFCEN